MRCINALALLFVLCSAAGAQSLPPVWPDASAELSAWPALADSVPRHPMSATALNALAEKAPGDSRDAKLLTLAVSLADSPMGIYALDSWYDTAPPDQREATLRTLIQTQPNTRVAARAVDLLLSMGLEPIALCNEVLALGGKASSRIARLRLADTYAQQGDFPSALLNQLHAFGDALDVRVSAAGTMYPALRRYFFQSGLTHLRAEWDTLSVPDLEAERDLAFRFAAQVHSTLEPSSMLHALWKAQGDPVVIQSLVDADQDDTLFDVRALLELARSHIASEDYEAYTEVAAQLDALFNGTPEDAVSRLVLALGWQRMVHDARAITPDRDSRALTEEHARSSGRRALQFSMQSGLPKEEQRLLLNMSAGAFQSQERWDAELVALEQLLPLVDAPVRREQLFMRLAMQHIFYTRDHKRIAELEEAIAESTQKPELAERARYVVALSHYMAEDYPAARESIEVCRSTATDITRDKLTLLEALVHFRSGKQDEARLVLTERLASLPLPQEEAHFRALAAYLKTQDGTERDAVADYSGVVSAFPDHKVTPTLKYLLRGMRPSTSLSAQPPKPGTPNVLLLSVDTVRADHLGCYGYERPSTPNIDALAREGTLFERAYSTSSWTKPSHASVFTGLYPQVHGAAAHDDLLLDAFPSLPELFGQAGYTTLGVVSAPPLNRLFGFARGFQRYDDYTWTLDREANLFLRNDGRQIAIHSGYTSSLMTDTAISFFDKGVQPDRPFFYFVNYFDAHHNYQPPAAYGQDWRAEYMGTQFGEIDQWNGSKETADADIDVIDPQRLRDLYDAELSYVDEQLGRLLAHLRDTGQWDNTIVVLFSDHGDEFLEHGGLAHGHTLFNEVIHVPLIVAGPGVPKGQRVTEPVSLVDVLPTLAALTGVSAPDELHGVALLEGGAPAEIPDRHLFAGLDLPPYRINALLADDLKLIRNLEPASQLLFQIADDAPETEEVTGYFPQLSRELSQQLEGFLSASQAERIRRTGGASTKITAAPESLEEMERQLRALGYL